MKRSHFTFVPVLLATFVAAPVWVNAAGPAIQPVAKAIATGDVLQITIKNLIGPGITATKTLRVSDSGTVSVPLVGEPVHVAGSSLKDAAADAAVQLRKTMGRDSVSVAFEEN